MKITKNIISRDEALKISADYVTFVEGKIKGKRFFDNISTVLDICNKMKRGQKAITFIDGKFVEVKVTFVDHNDWRAIDGPIVRVGNGEYTWRVDGDHWAFPIDNSFRNIDVDSKLKQGVTPLANEI